MNEEQVKKQINIPSFAKIVYEAYCKSCGGKAFNGDPLPTWDYLVETKPEIAQHWCRAVTDIFQAYLP